MVLPVPATEPAVTEQPVPAQLEHPRGQPQVARFTCGPAKFDERHLDAGMPVDPVPSSRPELAGDVVHRTLGDVEQTVVGECAVPCDRGLNQVTDAVELVPPGKVGVRLAAAHHLDEAVDIAVRSLGGRDDRDGLVRRRPQRLVIVRPSSHPAASSHL